MRILNIFRKCEKSICRTTSIQWAQPSKCISTKLIKTIEKKFERMHGSNSKSLLAKHLSPQLILKLHRLETPTYKSNLLDCTSSGFENLDSIIGTYASDPETYTVFKDLFDPIIKDLHDFGSGARQKQQEFGKLEVFKDIDPYQHFILSTRIRAVRNFEAFPFVPKMNLDHFLEIEDGMMYMLKKFPTNLKGFYIPLNEMFGKAKEKLIDDHVYKEPDRFMRDANMLNLNPRGRAVYVTADKKFAMLVNHEDHLKIICMQQGGDFGAIYERFIRALELVYENYSFHTSERLGILTCSPINLGTGIRASILIKLFKLSKNPTTFNKILKKYNLQVRGTYGSHSPVIDNVYDISNKNTLGLNEYEIVRNVYEAAQELMTAERCAKICQHCKLYTL